MPAINPAIGKATEANVPNEAVKVVTQVTT